MLLQCDAKLCTKCKKTKPLTDFNKGQDNGYRYQCKECNLKYQANSTTRKAVANRYYQRRKEKIPLCLCGNKLSTGPNGTMEIWSLQ